MKQRTRSDSGNSERVIEVSQPCSGCGEKTEFRHEPMRSRYTCTDCGNYVDPAAIRGMV